MTRVIASCGVFCSPNAGSHGVSRLTALASGSNTPPSAIQQDDRRASMDLEASTSLSCLTSTCAVHIRR